MKRYVYAGVILALFAAALFAQTAPYEPPKEIAVPGWAGWLINFFSQKFVIGFSAALAAALITIVGLIRSGLAAFGTKLSPRVIYIITALLAFVVAVATAGADGTISGDEWSIVLTGLLGFLGAIFGYRITFSTTAKAKQ